MAYKKKQDDDEDYEDDEADGQHQEDQNFGNDDFIQLEDPMANENGEGITGKGKQHQKSYIPY